MYKILLLIAKFSQNVTTSVALITSMNNQLATMKCQRFQKIYCKLQYIDKQTIRTFFMSEITIQNAEFENFD